MGIFAILQKIKIQRIFCYFTSVRWLVFNVCFNQCCKSAQLQYETDLVPKSLCTESILASQIGNFFNGQFSGPGPAQALCCSWTKCNVNLELAGKFNKFVQLFTSCFYLCFIIKLSTKLRKPQQLQQQLDQQQQHKFKTILVECKYGCQFFWLGWVFTL